MTAFYLVICLFLAGPAFGDFSSAMVRAVQEKLLNTGFDPGPVDGKIGSRTEGALKKFQETNGLFPSGKLDEDTKTALGLQLSAQGKTLAKEEPTITVQEKTEIQELGHTEHNRPVESPAAQPVLRSSQDPVIEPEMDEDLTMVQGGVEIENSLNSKTEIESVTSADRVQEASPRQPVSVKGKFQAAWPTLLRIFLLVALGLCALGVGDWMVMTGFGILLAIFVAETTGWRWALSFHVGFVAVYSIPLLLTIAWKNTSGVLFFLLLFGAPSFILSKYGLDSNWILAVSDGIAVMNLVPVSFGRMIARKDAFGVQREKRQIFKNKRNRRIKQPKELVQCFNGSNPPRLLEDETKAKPGSGFLNGLVVLLMAAELILFIASHSWAGFSRTDRIAFQRSIIDKRHTLNCRYSKTIRKKTKYIIVHTSEAGLQSTLHTVAKGKRVPRAYRTCGGHTHYVIARDGRTYRILDKQYIADHAGISMWNNEKNISKVSISIELVGYHYMPITDKQYVSAGILIDILMDLYGINDRAVLTHSQIAYGGPNRWFTKAHRGRKRCAKNFERLKAGLGPTWTCDPDTRAGRLLPDPTLAAIFYGFEEDPTMLIGSNIQIGSNIIDEVNTAWSIAGEDYDAPTSLYRFPDGRVIMGDKIEERIGWSRIPKNTVLLLNQENNPQNLMGQSLIKTISDGLTAWSLAGDAYNDRATQYFFPKGNPRNGEQISDWTDLPIGTRLIIGYDGPFEVSSKRSLLQIAGNSFSHRNTLYYLPDNALISGDRIEDYSRLPRGALIFLPRKKS